MSEAKSGGALVLVLVAASALTGGVLAQDAGSSTTSSIVDGVFTATQASSGQQQFQRAGVRLVPCRQRARRAHVRREMGGVDAR